MELYRIWRKKESRLDQGVTRRQRQVQSTSKPLTLHHSVPDKSVLPGCSICDTPWRPTQERPDSPLLPERCLRRSFMRRARLQTAQCLRCVVKAVHHVTDDVMTVVSNRFRPVARSTSSSCTPTRSPSPPEQDTLSSNSQTTGPTDGALQRPPRPTRTSRLSHTVSCCRSGLSHRSACLADYGLLQPSTRLIRHSTTFNSSTRCAINCKLRISHQSASGRSRNRMSLRKSS